MALAAAKPAEPGTPRRGRPRRAGADETILTATLELLGEAGVAGLSMDVVAQRAGVGKATIYRRWPSKEALILDTLRTMSTPLGDPDTGDLREDLLSYLAAIVERFAGGRGSDVLPHLIEASCFDPQLRASLDEYVRSRQSTLRRILQRGVKRGELSADAELDVLVDVLLAPFFYRNLLTGRAIDATFAQRLVALVLPA
jgi:AcrR family transcriptional regulator